MQEAQFQNSERSDLVNVLEGLVSLSMARSLTLAVLSLGVAPPQFKANCDLIGVDQVATARCSVIECRAPPAFQPN